MMRGDQIAAALADVRVKIAEAEARAHRVPGSVRLIAVSKKMPPDDVRAAWTAGQQDFGENYAQELRDKRLALQALAHPAPSHGQTLKDVPRATPGGELRWHYLGPIQSNKVKYLAGQVALIQSVDDAETLVEIERRAGASGAAQACLVQVNVAGENRKGGVPPHRLSAILDRFSDTPHVTCAGLMLIPPLVDDPTATRRHFAGLRELAEREARIARPNVALTELSMGMSNDFAAAVAEGATMVRIGTAIFGARPAG